MNEELDCRIAKYQTIIEDLYVTLCESKQECERLRRENILLRSQIRERSYEEDYDD